MKCQNLRLQADNYIFSFHMSVCFQTSCNMIRVLEGNKEMEGTNKRTNYRYISVVSHNSYF
jgi:hypothetical protein